MISKDSTAVAIYNTTNVENWSTYAKVIVEHAFITYNFLGQFSLYF
jgi:hypothetical protein